MYAIYVDGQLLYSTAIVGEESIVLSPKLSLDVDAAGSLSFVLPPGNRMYNSIRKMKSIITVEQDGEQIFRGRVLDDEVDFYKQKTVYCEGERSFLLDSVQRPYEFSGIVRDLFKKYISNHNTMVEAERQFTVGTIDAVSADETLSIENESYSSTSSEIENKLLNAYGGYLRTRTVGTKHYIDWVENYGGTSSQAIEFSVNLLDLKDKIDAGDVFTVLIPLGASELNDEGEYTDPLTVASVNGGKDYIQDDDAIALFGKIWRTRTWSQEDNATELLEKGREYLETGVAINTITLKAVDWHFVDSNTERIKLGDKVRILSNPHGVDKTTICAQLDIDLINPEKTTYTFGEAPKTLTENMQVVEEEMDNLSGGGGGGRSVKDEISDIIRWARINVSELNANILLTTGEINNLKERTTRAEIEIDGLSAEISLHAEEIDDAKERISAAEIRIDGAESNISLYAGRIDDLTDRVSSAEVRINGAEATIDLKVDKNGVISAINLSSESVTISSAKINLEGYVTASQLSAEIADITNAYSERVLTNTLTATSGFFTNLSTSTIKFNNSDLSFKNKTVLTGVPSFTTATITDANGNSRTVVTGWADAPSAYQSNIHYLSS